MAIISTLTDIADAIRDKLGTSDTIKMTDMAARIADIPTPGPAPTPTITVSSAGLVSASASGQTATHQLSSTDDTDFVAANIKSGVTIFGLLGSYSPTYDTPSITVSSSGLITASANGKSATQQLTTQSAKTVTPGTSSQTAVASGRYTTGTITVSGDANLVASNIRSGVSIFGVNGSLAIQTFYTGSSTPSSTLGTNGDLYLMTS